MFIPTRFRGKVLLVGASKIPRTVTLKNLKEFFKVLKPGRRGDGGQLRLGLWIILEISSVTRYPGTVSGWKQPRIARRQTDTHMSASSSLRLVSAENEVPRCRSSSSLIL